MSESDTLQTAVDAAKVAGEILLRYLEQGVQMRNKSADGGHSYDLVSDADIDSERAVADLIRSRFPDHELLGEENLDGDRNAEHLWIIDPLDGTNNYAHGVPHFAVSIAYYRRGQPVSGAVYHPSRDVMYTATADGPAKIDGVPVRVGDENSLADVLVGCGFYYDRGEVMRKTLATIESLFAKDIHGIRRMGTASLDLIMVGCGMFGGFFEFELSPWDFAAGRLFVERAGGKVTTCTGEALGIQRTSLLATNGRLHDEMLDIVSSHYRGEAG